MPCLRAARHSLLRWHRSAFEASASAAGSTRKAELLDLAPELGGVPAAIAVALLERRGSSGDGCAEASGTVTAHNFYARVLTQPGCDCLCASVRQQIHHSSLLKIAKNGSVAMTPFPCPLVDAEHARCSGYRGMRLSAELAKQSRSACKQAQFAASRSLARPPSASVTQLRASLERQLRRA